jgi:hypothetical protein
LDTGSFGGQYQFAMPLGLPELDAALVSTKAGVFAGGGRMNLIKGLFATVAVAMGAVEGICEPE